MCIVVLTESGQGPLVLRIRDLDHAGIDAPPKAGPSAVHSVQAPLMLGAWTLLIDDLFFRELDLLHGLTSFVETHPVAICF
jgi:hypothetical protein